MADLGAAPSVRLHLRVYGACVPPVGSYACELWSLQRLTGKGVRARRGLLSAHFRQL